MIKPFEMDKAHGIYYGLNMKNTSQLTFYSSLTVHSSDKNGLVLGKSGYGVRIFFDEKDKRG